MNRRMIALLILVLLLVLGLGGLYLYLTGARTEADRAANPAETGLVHIRTIYTANGVNLTRPVGVGADNDGFYITLRDAQKVIEFDRSGDYVRMWGERGLGVGQLMVPLGVTVDRLSGHVYVTDRSRFRLLAYDMQGSYLWEIPVLNALTPFITEEGVGVTSFGPVVMFDPEGQLLREFGTRGPDEGQFDYPRAAAEFSDGDLAIADTNNTRIQRIEPSGEITATVKWVQGVPPRFQDDPETVFGVPSGICIDDQDRVFVLDGFRHAIQVLDGETGEIIHTFEDLEGNADGLFYLPTGIAYMGDSTFVVTDSYNDRVQIFRLLLPDENNVLARNPWLKWLLLLLLLPLLWLLGKKRTYVTGEAMDLAAGEQRLRLLVGAYGTLRVLPEVHERYKDVVEEDVVIEDYLERLDVETAEEDRELVLAQAAVPTRWRRLLMPRHLVVVIDEPQGERIADAGVKRLMTYDEVKEEFILDDDGGAAEAPTDEAPGA